MRANQLPIQYLRVNPKNVCKQVILYILSKLYLYVGMHTHSHTYIHIYHMYKTYNIYIRHIKQYLKERSPGVNLKIIRGKINEMVWTEKSESVVILLSKVKIYLKRKERTLVSFTIVFPV